MPGLRSRTLRAIASVGTLAVVASTLTVSALVAAPTAAEAAPGNPGTPSAPTVVFNENFNNRADLTPIVRLSQYTGATGQTYTASAPWLTACNGWIAASAQNAASPAQVADCESSNVGSGQGNWNSAQQLADVLGRYAGVPRPDYNFAVTAYTSNSPGADQIEFATGSNINLPSANGRFLTFSVDVATINCPPVAAAPGLDFSLVNAAGAPTPVGGTINPCATGQSIQAPSVGAAPARPANVGTYTSNGSVLMSGSSFGIRMTNATGTGGGNDHAFDNMRVLDVTPQLDKSFGDTSIAAGGTTTLTFTVTNTSELAAKEGWSFTDALPAGMTVAGPSSTTCANGVVDAPTGGSSIGVTGDLNAGQTACTISVGVTASAPGTYTNGPGNVTETGLNPPGETSLIVYPLVDCTTDPAIFNTGFNAATGGTVPTGGVDQRWTVAGGATGIPGIAGTQLPPAGATFAPAEVGKINSLWADSPFGNAQWISGDYTTTGQNQPTGSSADWYYRYQFVLADEVDVESFSLNMNWLADNAIAGVWVNDAPQSGENLPQGGGAPYVYAGFTLDNAAQTTLAGDWQTGLNTIMVQVKSAAPAEGFDAQVQSTALCADPNLDIDKTSTMTADSRPGDTITYTVTATNDGTGPFTAEEPALVADSLTELLDDAAYNGDAVATIDGETVAAPTRSGDVILWSGPLDIGQTVTITYTVTLGARTGDGEVRNVAWAPPPGEGPPPTPPACDPPTEEGTDPVTGAPCAVTENELPALTISKSASSTELPADGEELTYTVTVTNPGPGDYTAAAPATFTDDLTEVIDDAVLDVDSITTTVGDVPTYEEPTLSWSGALAAGQSATFTYTVTYNGDGDNVLTNEACVPADEAIGPDCDVVQVPGPDLVPSKTATPSATPLAAGETITYTLRFDNDGQAAATVDTFDDLTAVVDDADLTGAITASEGLTAVREGDRILITGTVAPGAVGTVTYTVTLRPDGERGDNRALNFLGRDLPPGDLPECVPTDAQAPDCTENEIPEVSYAKAVTASTNPIGPGTTLAYTITVRNTGAATGNVSRVDDLRDVLDDTTLTTAPSVSGGAGVTVTPVVDGYLTIGGTLGAGQTATVTYTVTVNDEGERGNNRATNYLVENEGDEPDPCVEGSPECTDTPLPNVTPAKSVDPEKGTTVLAGQVLTYTLTFTNSGTDVGAVAYTDYLERVLDDAELTSAPTVSSDTIAAELDGDTIVVTGTLAADATATVTYQVTVLPDGQRGDHNLGNFVRDSNDPPPTADEPCAEDDVTCTENDVPFIRDSKTANPPSGDPVAAGQTITYTLTFWNDGAAAGGVVRDDVLTGVVDDADLSDGPTVDGPDTVTAELVDDRIEVRGTLAAGETATVTYSVVIRAWDEQGDHNLGNFLVNGGDEPPTACEPAPGEDPDCTRHPIGHIVASKSVDPESTTAVEQGDVLTYTLTFRNTGEGTAAVDYVDRMSDVLDDATITRPAAASADTLELEMSDDVLSIGGPLAAGQTATVTYQVTVKAYDRQGNHVLGNFLGLSNEPPAPACVEGSALCTTNPIDPPPALAITGGTIGFGAIAAAIIAILGGGLLLALRKRREFETTDEIGTLTD